MVTYNIFKSLIISLVVLCVLPTQALQDKQLVSVPGLCKNLPIDQAVEELDTYIHRAQVYLAHWDNNFQYQTEIQQYTKSLDYCKAIVTFLQTGNVIVKRSYGDLPQAMPIQQAKQTLQRDAQEFQKSANLFQDQDPELYNSFMALKTQSLAELEYLQDNFESLLIRQNLEKP